MEKQYILFFSNKCEYSNMILKKITHHNLQDYFMMVNITKGFKVPKFVDRVPMIYLKESKEIIVDESIENFIDLLIRNASVPKQDVINSSTSINPNNRASDEMLGDISCAYDHMKGISDGFSFIQGSQNMFSRNYIPLNKDSDISMQMQNTSLDTGLKESKFSQQQFDNFVNQRDSDVASIFPRRNVV